MELEATTQELREARVLLERQAAQLRAFEADRQALTALLAHDLRAPLTTMRANLDWATGELPPGFDVEVVSALTEARQLTDRLAGMLGDLVHIARFEAGTPPAREAQPCGAMLGRLQRQLEVQGRGRKVAVELQVDDFVLEADHGVLMRALEILSNTALRYTPAGGRVRLEGRPEGTKGFFAVRHEGPVISADLRATLFDKYEPPGPPREHRRAGWGLGLYFCRRCVEAHGGELAVEDADGWGTSFVLRVPGVVSS